MTVPAAGAGSEPAPGPPTAGAPAAGGVESAEPREQRGTGLPDAFARLYTPHRMAYIRGEGKASPDRGCPFCDIPGLPDGEGLVVARGEQAYAVLNLYPYNSGHLMVVPFRHVAAYEELTADEASEVARLTQHALRALRHATGAQGFNVGMNLGVVGGAGIAAHLHQHVVPRWGGDTNFMPVIGHTKVLPQLLPDTRDLLAEAWRRV